MKQLSTCRSCGEVMEVIEYQQYWHPTCPPKPTRMERLCQEYVDLAQQHPGSHPRLAQLESEIDEMQSRPPKLGAAALLYASYGWPVFPLRPRGTRCDGDDKCDRVGLCQCPKKPATKNGFKDATTDPDRLKSWWERYPDSNIGLATGFTFDVIDVDVPVGLRSWDALDYRLRPEEVHGRVSTASGGFHLYVAPSGDGNRAGVEPGIDYRGKGGYVVAPPSTLGVRGRAWSWVVHPSPELTRKGQVA